MQRYWHRECIRSPCREVPPNQLDKLDVDNKLNNNINIKTIIASLQKKRNTWEKAFPVKQSYVLAFYVKLFCRLTSNFVFSCVAKGPVTPSRFAAQACADVNTLEKTG